MIAARGDNEHGTQGRGGGWVVGKVAEAKRERERGAKKRKKEAMWGHTLHLHMKITGVL